MASGGYTRKVRARTVNVNQLFHRMCDKALRPYLTNPVDRGEESTVKTATNVRESEKKEVRKVKSQKLNLERERKKQGRLGGGAYIPPVKAGSISTSFPSLSCARRSNTDRTDATVMKIAARE